MGDTQDGWRGSYDGWLTTDPRDSEPDVGRRTTAERSPTAARDAFGRGPHYGMTATEAYQIARRALRTARELKSDPVMKADWLSLAVHTRGLARDLRAKELRRRTA
jgi:hypothetical protein